MAKRPSSKARLAVKNREDGNAPARGKDVGSSPMRSDHAAGNPPVRKNEEHVAEIIGVSHEGAGVGRVNGFTLFVSGALPGEKVRVKVLKVKKQYGYAKLLEVIEPSADRTDAPCPVFRQCGGCQLQHWAYGAQLRWKRQSVIDALERIGKIAVAREPADTPADVRSAAAGAGNNSVGVDTGVSAVRFADADTAISAVRSADADLASTRGVIVHPTIGMADPWRYRNKAQVPLGYDREGGLIGGFYAQASHRIIDADACLIQHEQNDRAVLLVKEAARRLGIPAYDEERHEGVLRHVVARTAFHTGEVMVVLVTNGRHLPHRERLVDEIRAAVPGVASICQNINEARTNVIFGEETKVLWGRDVIYDTIGDIRFAISARSFYQVNPAQTRVLYEKALEYAGLTGEETVIDAYCGIGTISLFLARRAKRVYGVEIVPEAVADARRNAELNGIANAEFAVGKAEEVIPAWKRDGISADVIVVDPPRKGCDAALLDTIIAMRPRRVVYVSCNPATLARDLRILEDGGFRTVEAQPVDMFPHTTHVECVILMVRQE